ncbi:Retinoid-inducible serine carboxypeptidase [Papilio machaon]|uniref:Retinoid-inducible serine carboxypeptidase n=1 Tax=Papilio machaon TaxID=76193 RepID=A0A194QPS0_PAPMA|nr:Retinoid-inducible serine carboxypeptidase [Papilio machaon]
MLFYIFLITAFVSHCSEAQFGPYKQASDYVTVREGAHMFYWLYYTTAPVKHYTERPIIIWLQGGPGGSSTGIGNFEILGPQDLSLKDRNYTWVKNFNVMFVDNPVGTGFSYVDDVKYLTKTNLEIATDFVELMKGFYESHREFEGVPVYIYGQSYGGKMAIDIGIEMHKAEKEGTLKSNLRGIAMGNAWISPVDATLTWGPLLLAAGLVDQDGYESIQAAARKAERLFNEGSYVESTNQWAQTQRAVFAATTSVDFYDILAPRNVTLPDTRKSAYEVAREMMIRDSPLRSRSETDEWDTHILMNTRVKQALRIPEKVRWQASSNAVFNAQNGDFMKPVTDGIEKLLNETDIILTKYNGNADLICSTPGQILWVDRLQWAGAEQYKNSPRRPIWENDRLEGYYKAHGNFRFFWINTGSHSAPRSSPEALSAVLRDMTTFG